MKTYVIFLNIIFISVLANADETAGIINNTNQPLSVDYKLPIYSRADLQIKPIKSKQELQDLLHEAILNNSTKEILHVVQAGADVNIFKDGKSPLLWAILLKKLNSVEVLKKCGAVIPCPKIMMYRAILNDSPQDIRAAIEAGANAKEAMGTATSFARYNSINTLLELGVPASLDLAIKSMLIGDIESALLLLKNTNLSNQDRQFKKIEGHTMNHQDLFQYAVSEIDPAGIKDIFLEFVQTIVDKGYDINTISYNNHMINREFTTRASAWKSVISSAYFLTEVLELMMKNGANPNQIIYDTHVIWTPLFIAIEKNNPKAVRFLLEAGADVTKKAGPAVRTKDRTINPPQTPLSYAKALALTGIENDEIIKLLVSYKAPL